MIPYVINLDRSPERWAAIQSEWGIPLQRVSAVEASPGWIGCALSHIKVIEEAKARGDPYVLVWEDDCIPMKRNGEPANVRVIKRLWDNVMERLSAHPARWDIVLGATSKIFDRPILDPVLSTNLVKIFRITKGFTTHWTLYNASIYDSMIEWKKTQPSQIDVYMYEKARVYVTLPFLAEQRAGFSTIENNQQDYHRLFDSAEKTLQGTRTLNVEPQVTMSVGSIKLPQAKIKLYTHG
jgi:hypothetical protein